ncbi:MAG: TetR/AcrR family transcriptional regulator [Clostridia bacterium]|nr:TetR/AcrR family transcriptional regulator [Clostridia bacterium]
MTKSESKYFNTAQKMDNALLELLEKKDFEYITIKEICKKADVSRSTFYLHYQNTRDLLDETARYILDGFMDYFTDEKKLITGGFSDCSLSELNFMTEKYLMPFLQYFRENKRLFKTMMSNSVSFDFNGIYERLFKYVFNPVLSRFDFPEKERHYVMRFYLSGIFAVIMQWVEENCEKSDEDIAGIITTCVLGKNKELKKLIDR